MAEKNTASIGFEKQIWDAACVLRGNMDASEYKKGVMGGAERFALKTNGNHTSPYLSIYDKICYNHKNMLMNELARY